MVCSNAESDSSFSMEILSSTLIVLDKSTHTLGYEFPTFNYLALLVRLLSPKEF